MKLKNIVWSLLGIVLFSCNSKIKDTQLTYNKDRISAILLNMSDEEKIAQLQGIWLKDLLDGRELSLDSCRKKIPNGIGHFGQFAGSTDLNPIEIRKVVNEIQLYLLNETPSGIPALFSDEAICGFSAKGATTLPQQIGMGCTWNTKLLKENTAMSAKLMRKVGATQVLSPMLDICRNSHWGRIEESFGEEPYLTATMGLAFVEGLQGDNLKTGVAATIKHFAGYGGGTDNEKTLHEEVLLPHEATVRFGNAQSVMAGYHAINGVPCTANKMLLTDILRDKYGFEGMVVSDFWSVQQVWSKYKFASSEKEAGIKSLKAGCDVELPFGMSFPYFKEALAEGSLTQEDLNIAVKRVLVLKDRLGLLDYEELNLDEPINLDPPENRVRAHKAATESIVLLKNNGVLPISKEVKKIALVGPNADAVESLLGDYSYQSLAAYWWEYPIDKESPKLITLYDGLKTKLSKDVKLTYERGCDWTKSLRDEIDELSDIGDERSKNVKYISAKNRLAPNSSEAIKIAKDSDIIIAAMGEQLYLVGENRDRKDIRLPGEQEAFVKKLIETGKPVILVIFGGRPQIITDIEEGCHAILQAWFPGEEGGNAVADILLGNEIPSGKLTVTYPRNNQQAPIVYSQGYEANDMPMYPFGYGLSFTTFDYNNLTMPKEANIQDKRIEISFEISNTGDFEGSEIAQLYVSPPKENKGLEPIELKGFIKTNILKGQNKKVTISVSPEQLAYYNQGKWEIDPGVYEFKVGASSLDIRLSGEVNIKGEKTVFNQRSVLFSENRIEE
ncbi:glycoside hydrolase family 3 N-terminal domain-containing protein [Lutibacter citreus]|uniref:glycoside hydrolase family 3 N-terminal domain-containing protein n=1 Tax=Lutibacter citreus TaxID=2138210 RepID=UPI000DBEA1DC|nr:glycoside hydrolase family 3 N-terminal domain-containing protein [Lutibacter citreus]